MYGSSSSRDIEDSRGNLGLFVFCYMVTYLYAKLFGNNPDEESNEHAN